MKLLHILITIALLSACAAIPHEGKRIVANEVNIHNYEGYISQLKDDLPLGTSRQVVENYLYTRNINFGYASTEGSIKFMLKNIDSWFFIFITDLQVRIYVSEEAGVSEIKARLVETAL